MSSNQAITFSDTPTQNTSLGSKFIAVLDKISKIDEIVASSLLAVIVALMAYGVVTRYVLNAPSPWVEEVCLAMFIWFALLGSSALMRQNELVNVDFVLRKLPPKMADIIDNVFQPIVIIVSLAFMVYWGWKLVGFSQVRFTPALKIPYLYIYSAVPVSATFMLYHQLRRLGKYFSR